MLELINLSLTVICLLNLGIYSRIIYVLQVTVLALEWVAVAVCVTWIEVKSLKIFFQKGNLSSSVGFGNKCNYH